jgi:glycosyltransferase involved in cell wall biosynthesis
MGDWTMSHAHEARGVYIAWWLKRLRGIRYLVTRRMQQSPSDRFVTRLAYQQADKLVGISSAACTSMQAIAPRQKIACIPSAHSGRAPDRDAATEIRRNLIQEPEAILIGHAGALRDSHKGQRVLIEAGKQLRALGHPVEVVFFGEGPDRHALERETSALHWVRFLGQVSPIQDYLAAVDVFAFPSRHEGLGSVLLEAMLVEVPVVATRVGGIPDLIEDSVSGLLVEPNNPVALSDAIGKLIDNPDLEGRLIEKARSTAYFKAPEAMARLYEQRYWDMISRVRI